MIRKEYEKDEWQSILDGPAPFSSEEEQIIRRVLTIDGARRV